MQSVDRAISVLQVLARRRVAGVIEIADELSIHKSTVSRLLGTLEARGLIEQTSPRGPYRLAYGVVQLAERAGQKHDITVTSRSICRELAEDLGETVNVVVHEGRSIVTVDQAIGASSLKTVNWVGMRSPLHATSAGKIFLAAMSRDELRDYLTAELERFTEHTIVDPVRMEAELASVRENGYAVLREEQEVGVSAVAAPIRALDGRVIGALTVSGPALRFDEAAIPGIVEHLLDAAARISERNGYPRRG